MRTRKKWPTVLGIILILVVAGGLIYRFGFYQPTSQAATTQIYQSYTVTASDIALNVQGSGAVEAGRTERVTAGYAGSVLTVKAADGDHVKAGDILATFELTELEDEIAQLRTDLVSADADLERLDATTGTTAIVSPVKGLVKSIHVSANDLIDVAMEKHGAIMVISIDKKMTVTVKPASISTLEAGQSVTVTIDTKTTTGRIREILPDSSVVVLFDDAGYAVDAAAVVTLVDGPVLGQGKTAINQPFLVTATGGVVNYLSTSVGKTVYVDTTLLRLKEQVLTPAYLQALQTKNQLQSELFEKLALDQVQTITAPIDGIVSELTLNTNDLLKENQVICSIVDDSVIELTLDVDELDIPTIALGQTANVTLDALTDKSYAATVTRISSIGSYSGGVATYPVTLTIELPTGIFAGMSANATIIVSSSTQVPVIPLAALQTIGNRRFVLSATALNADGTLITNTAAPTTAATTNASGEGMVPSGMGGQFASPLQPYLIEVTVGLSAENGVEITSGVNIGDKIAIAVSNSAVQPTGLNLGGLTGSGGMPGGTRPSGPFNPGTRSTSR